MDIEREHVGPERILREFDLRPPARRVVIAGTLQSEHELRSVGHRLRPILGAFRHGSTTSVGSRQIVENVEPGTGSEL